MYSVIPVYDVAKRYGHRLCGLGISEADHVWRHQAITCTNITFH